MAAAARAAATLWLAAGMTLLPAGAFAGATIQLAEAGFHTKPVDFAVDGTHAYVVYARSPHWPVPAGAEDLVLGIYERGSGGEVATVNLAELWDVPQGHTHVPVVKVIAHRGGAAVAAVNSVDHATLAYVSRNGEVRARRLVKDYWVIALARHRNFLLAASSEGTVTLFDERLDLTHEWSATDKLLLADSNEDAITVVDGILNPSGGVGYAATVRRLVVADRIEEVEGVPVPVDVAVFPSPRLLSWPGRLALFTHDKQGGWRECRLVGSRRRFECGEAPWTRDLKALHPGLEAGYLIDVVRSGAGYLVTTMNGCAVWSRRYSRSRSIAARQLALPSGSSDFGMLHGWLVREWQGRVFLLSWSFLSSRWEGRWAGGEYRAVLREGILATAPPVQPSPKFEGCPAWSDAQFAQGLTANEVRSCVAKGADPNVEFNCGAWTRPLAMAAREGNEAAVRALLDAGAEVNAQDEEGHTALHNAARHARSGGTLQALLDGGADATLRTRGGKLAWDFAQGNDALRDLPVVRKLPRPR